MTGYGHGEAVAGDLKFVVELSSVNRKQSDVVVNLPRKLIELEGSLRKAVAGRISRGRVSVLVTVESTEGRHGALELDEPLAGQYRDAMETLSRVLGKELHLEPSDLLRAPGVFTIAEVPLEPESARPVLEEALGKALEVLIDMQQREGSHLAEDIGSRLGLVGKELASVRKLAPRVAETYRTNLHKRLEEAGIPVALDDERILKEIGLFADRCDITEELTRLESHLNQFGDYLDSDQSAGRPMDFLSQEIHRELNTIGSKANDAAITQHVVNSKTEMEKVREQVQNIQ